MQQSGERIKITSVKFSDIDIKSEDVRRVIKKFPNLQEISFKFGPFVEHFQNGIPLNMPDIILEDYTHGENHVRFLLEFMKKSRTIKIRECDYHIISERIRRNPELAKKIISTDGRFVNLERIAEIDLEEKVIEVNSNNLRVLPDEVLEKARKIVFIGSIEDIRKLSADDLKKLSEVRLVINKAGELSGEQLDKFILDKKIPIAHVQLFSEYNSLSQNIFYDVETYKILRKKLEDLVSEIPENLSEERCFAEIYKKVANDIEYDYEKYDDNESDYKNSRNLVNPLLKRKGVCAGISDVLDHALSLKNIKSVKASGEIKDVDESHNWNKVRINGIWYNVDITWDLPEIKKGKIPYFALKSDEFFEKTRIEDTFERKTPICTKSVDKYFIRRIFGYRPEENLGLRTKCKKTSKAILQRKGLRRYQRNFIEIARNER